MSENTENAVNNAISQNQETPQDKVVTPLARGNAPALGVPQEQAPSNDDKQDKQDGSKEPSKAPVANDDVDDNELAKTDNDIPDDRYVETTIEEVNDLVSELKRLKVPYAKANMLMEEAFNSADASKLSLENFEAILGKENAKALYMYAKVAVAAIKNTKEADSKELDTLAGGSWKSLASKAKQMLPKSDLKEYQELIDMGGAARKLAIRELIAKTSNKTANKTLLTGDNSSVSDDYAISSMEYKKEADKIRRDFSRAGMLTKEGFMKMKALDDRRLNSIKMGIK